MCIESTLSCLIRLIVLFVLFYCRYRLLADNRHLQITGAQVTPDTARYTCIAMNEAGVADRDFDLDVLGTYVYTIYFIYLAR